MIKVTDKAALEIKRLQAQEADSSSKLRIKVIGAGCSGYSYKLDFDNQPESSGDKIFEVNGVLIVVNPKSLLFLTGIELDFSDGLTGQGFTFNNPNAKRTCGCGSSFSV